MRGACAPLTEKSEAGDSFFDKKTEYEARQIKGYAVMVLLSQLGKKTYKKRSSDAPSKLRTLICNKI